MRGFSLPQESCTITPVMAKTRVVILAAGKGKRMGSDVPKPLVPIAGEPMIAHLLRSVIASGVDSRPIVLVAPDSRERFVAAVGQFADFAEQTEQLGTGHAVMCAKDAIGSADRVVVLYGDHPFISSEVLRRLVDLHDDTPQALAMLTSVVPNFDAPYDVFRGWGRVIRDDSGSVATIREAKDASASELHVREVNPAIYAFPAAWLWEHLPKLGNKNASVEYYLTDLIPMAFAEGMPIVTAQADALDVVGVNTPDELAKAEAIFQRKKIGM